MVFNQQIINCCIRNVRSHFICMLEHCLWMWEILFRASTHTSENWPCQGSFFPIHVLFTHGKCGTLSPTLCFCVTSIKQVFVFPVWLVYWTYRPSPRRGTTGKRMDAEQWYILWSCVCSSRKLQTYYKKWRVDVTATLGKFEIAVLSRWVKNCWSIQKGSI